MKPHVELDKSLHRLFGLVLLVVASLSPGLRPRNAASTLPQRELYLNLARLYNCVTLTLAELKCAAF